MRLTILIVLFVLPLCGGHPATAAAPVLEAMQAEMARAMQHLRIEPNSPPYYLSYMIQDSEMTVIEARWGAIVQDQRTRSRHLYTDLRVGSPEFDNSGFVASWRDMYRQRLDLPVEDDDPSLRHHMWLSTDALYKQALESRACKRAYLQTHPAKEDLADFSPATCARADLAHETLDPDQAAWADRLRAAAAVLRGYPRLQDGRIVYVGADASQRYVNSEGGRHTKGGAYQYITISATAQAEDGQRLNHFTHFTVSGNDHPPSGEELIAAVTELAAELEEMIQAPVLEEFAGPALFYDFAAAQLLSQLLVDQITPAREAIAVDEWMNDYLPSGKLPRRLNRRILPAFVNVTDEPQRVTWDGRQCAGHLKIDDEGVASETLTLVKNGRLVDLPMTRTPIKKLTASNGHARMLPNQWVLPCVTNVVVESTEPQADLVEQLRELCRAADVEFGLMIKRLADPDVDELYRWTDDKNSEPSLLTAPVVFYRVYAADGRTEPVRGLVFDEVTIRTLRDIAALGKDTRLTNMRQPTGFPGISYPVSIITPSILVEEIELKEGAHREPRPLTKSPVLSHAR